MPLHAKPTWQLVPLPNNGSQEAARTRGEDGRIGGQVAVAAKLCAQRLDLVRATRERSESAAGGAQDIGEHVGVAGIRTFERMLWESYQHGLTFRSRTRYVQQLNKFSTAGSRTTMQVDSGATDRSDCAIGCAARSAS